MLKIRTKTLNMQKLERISRVGQTADLPLFDNRIDPPSYIHNDGIDERNQSHQEMKNCGHKELLVLAVITKHGPITDLRIADILGWKINQVTGRRNGLLTKKRIVKYGTVRNTETGKNNSLWSAV